MSNQIDPSQTLFDDPAAVVAPPAQDPATAAQAQPSWVGEIVTTIRDGLAGLRQDPATSVQAPAQIPNTWWETLTAEQQKELNDRSILNPAQTNAFISAQEAEHGRRKMIQDAAPLLNSQGRMIVDVFKADKRSGEKYYAQIAPLFDRMIAGLDLRPLVNMSDAARAGELNMRWGSAKAEVLEKVAAAPGQREPTLTSANGAPANTPAPGTAFEEDPMLAQMATAYGFTEEQKRALEAAAKDRE